MRFSSSEILPVARANGFSEQVVEKALHLLHLLNALNSHPSLKGSRSGLHGVFSGRV